MAEATPSTVPSALLSSEGVGLELSVDEGYWAKENTEMTPVVQLSHTSPHPSTGQLVATPCNPAYRAGVEMYRSISVVVVTQPQAPSTSASTVAPQLATLPYYHRLLQRDLSCPRACHNPEKERPQHHNKLNKRSPREEAVTATVLEPPPSHFSHESSQPRSSFSSHIPRI
ncbi:hypothetical protein GALMADRAFT_141309 [Galerina marginata CBS 339.88]|uniref:Uncharacterized protein n=1 Tax=Galerina marginata (strain CBS 339.88) TaxID=685588 RepID=A0A067STG0_GALM3|nr:hypothetical protein GALMADRAFT_141309 [Galerina marginata CBS 339.88]